MADAAAAYRLYGGPTIVVDFGTGTVFDAISKEGDYLGGAIAPGIEVAAEALHQTTSQLRRVDAAMPRRAIGRNTPEALQSGLMLGYVGLVEGMVRRFKEELGGEAKVVATGGLARVMAGATKIFDATNPDLTLIGLRMIYEMNRGPTGRETRLISVLQGKHVVLGVTGSIACYKAVDLASKLTQAGALVDVVMTEDACRFVSPLAFGSITHQPVTTSLFDPKLGVERGARGPCGQGGYSSGGSCDCQHSCQDVAWA